MPTVCVAAGCSNQKDDFQGTSLHEIPFFVDDPASGSKEAKEEKGRFCLKEEREVAAIEALGDMLRALQTRGF